MDQWTFTFSNINNPSISTDHHSIFAPPARQTSHDKAGAVDGQLLDLWTLGRPAGIS